MLLTGLSAPSTGKAGGASPLTLAALVSVAGLSAPSTGKAGGASPPEHLRAHASRVLPYPFRANAAAFSPAMRPLLTANPMVLPGSMNT